MRIIILDFLMFAGAALTALAIAAMCVLGFVVWLAGGKPLHHK